MTTTKTESGRALLRAIHIELYETCANYTCFNKPLCTDKIAGVGISYRESKMIATGFSFNGDSYADMGFTLKTMFIGPSGADFSIDTIIDGVVDNVIKLLSINDRGFKLVKTPTEALAYSGMNSSYISVLHRIEKLIVESPTDCEAVKIHWCGSDSFNNRCVGLVFKYAEKVFLLQFTD
jgi:hypothetical protein